MLKHMNLARASRALRSIVPAFVVAATGAGLALHGSWNKSETADERGHITSGHSYWMNDDYRLQPENGNLPQRIIALPNVLSGATFGAALAPPWRLKRPCENRISVASKRCGPTLARGHAGGRSCLCTLARSSNRRARAATTATCFNPRRNSELGTLERALGSLACRAIAWAVESAHGVVE